MRLRILQCAMIDFEFDEIKLASFSGMAYRLASLTLVPETWVQFLDEPSQGQPKPFIPLRICCKFDSAMRCAGAFMA